MKIQIACPECGKAYRVKKGLLGKEARCSKCRFDFTVCAENVLPEKASPDLSPDGLPVLWHGHPFTILNLWFYAFAALALWVSTFLEHTEYEKMGGWFGVTLGGAAMYMGFRQYMTFYYITDDEVRIEAENVHGWKHDLEAVPIAEIGDI